MNQHQRSRVHHSAALMLLSTHRSQIPTPALAFMVIRVQWGVLSGYQMALPRASRVARSAGGSIVVTRLGHSGSHFASATDRQTIHSIPRIHQLEPSPILDLPSHRYNDTGPTCHGPLVAACSTRAKDKCSDAAELVLAVKCTKRTQVYGRFHAGCFIQKYRLDRSRDARLAANH